MESYRPWLIAIFVAAVLVALPSHRARATGPVLTADGGTPASLLDLELAVAVTPFGSARWARLTIDGAPRVLWLVPARPGATFDWAPDAWLDALEDASTPRLTPPSDTPPCGMPSGAQRAPAWAAVGVRAMTQPTLVTHASASELSTYIAARGYVLPVTSSAKITEAFANGQTLASIEIETGGLRLTTPTLRITDDGPATLPLALTGSPDVTIQVTAFVLASGGATVAGAQEIDPQYLHWGYDGSGFAALRDVVIALGAGGAWLRESASHDVLFGDVAVPHAAGPIPSLASQYLAAADAAEGGCVAAAKALAEQTGTLGRVCAAGALGRAPGDGFTCVPEIGEVPIAPLSCGGSEDLAIALSGTAPATATLTRLTGVVERNAFGSDLPLLWGGPFLSPVMQASAYEPCAPAGTSGTGTPAGKTSETVTRPYHYLHDFSGCDGSRTTLVFEDTGEEDLVEDDPGCGGSTVKYPDPSVTETVEVDSTGSGSSSSSSPSPSTGSNASDLDEASGESDDSCGSSDSSSSSSSSSDSGGCGSSDSGSGDSGGGDDCSCSGGGGDDCGGGGGGDCEIAAQNSRYVNLGVNFGHAARGVRSKRHHGPSPVSRASLLLLALALPIRRRTRPRPSTAI